MCTLDIFTALSTCPVCDKVKIVDIRCEQYLGLLYFLTSSILRIDLGLRHLGSCVMVWDTSGKAACQAALKQVPGRGLRGVRYHWHWYFPGID